MATNAKDAKEAEAELDKAEEEFKKAVEADTKPVPPVNSDESEEEDEAQSDETSEAEDSTEEDSTESEATFTKGVPSIPGETPEEYYANLEKSYQESTKEALRLKALADEKLAPVKLESDTSLTPEQLYIKQKQDEEIATAFSDITENYPQVKEADEYKRFTEMANEFGKTILEAEKRLATPKELYAKTVIALGWTQEDSKEKLGVALKQGASSTRSGVASSPTKSKVTEQMIAENMKWYPDKTRADIIKELEPHIT